MSPATSTDRLEGFDPIEDALRITGAHAVQVSTLTGRGSWAMQFDAPPDVKFNAVVHGACVLEVDGLDPIDLAAGDVFLLTAPVAFRLRSLDGVALRPEPSAARFRASGGRFARIGDDAADVTAEVIGGSVVIDGPARELLLDAMPAVIRIPGIEGEAFDVPDTLRRIDAELRERRLGWRMLADALGLTLLVELLRAHVAAADSRGWIRGLGDEVVAGMLAAIHRDPAWRWTVQELAEQVHVSRATAAARFTRAVGTGPLGYLRRWRLALAAHRLVTTDQPIRRIALEVGYASEAALSHAFVRDRGRTPTEHRRAHRMPSAEPVLSSGGRRAGVHR